MRNKLSCLAILLLISSVLYSQINELPRSTPEAEGVPSKAIVALFDSLISLPKTDIHSVMVLRHGKVIGEIYPAPFAPEYQHTVYSCSKTFVATAVGLAIEQNRLKLTDRIGIFFPEVLPDSISQNLSDITVRDLLVMGSGITPDWNMRNRTSDWIRTYLAKPVKKPGERFEYDSMTTYVLSAIIQKVTGMRLLDFLKIHIFNPMNIKDVSWEISPEGYNTGGWGLYIQSESLAKFGLLFLNKGVWEGKQLLPASWVEQMTSKQVITGGEEDYGYNIWLSEYPGAVCIDGALGQYVMIMPDKDMVVVITECTLINGRTQRRLVWNRLLPTVKDEVLKETRDYKLLLKKQDRYQLPFVDGKASSPQTDIYNGKTIYLDKNKFGWKSISLQIGSKDLVMTVSDTINHSHDLHFGYKQWVKTSIDVNPPHSITPVDAFKGIEKPFWVAGSYAWQTTNTLQVKSHYVNWISSVGITLKFEQDKVSLIFKENYSSDEIIVNGRI